MFGTILRDKLKRGNLCMGGWITLGHSAIAEIFSNAGFDWIVVDLEHSTISIDCAGDLIRTIDLSNVTPIVRLTSLDPGQIKRILDAGAHGIIVPNVTTSQEARDAVGATRYAPNGFRGVGLGRAQKYGAGFKEYLEWQKNGPIVVVQIEHHSAINNLHDIFRVPGVDGFVIGPYDLSCSMGIPGEFNNSEFISAMGKILSIGLEVGCPAGIHIVEPDSASLMQSIREGYQLIAYGVDIRMLDIAARRGMEIAREAQCK